jgi:hypothetical protein
MSLENALNEIRYPNDDFLWYLNNPASKALFYSLLDSEFPQIQAHHEPILMEVYNWLHLVHDEFVKVRPEK